MSANFTPLIPPVAPAPPPGSSPLRTKLLSNATGFKPVALSVPCLHQTPTPATAPPTPEPEPAANSATFAPPAEPSAPPPPPAAPAPSATTVPSPTVSYIQENGQITRIRVQCPCGSLVELECLY